MNALSRQTKGEVGNFLFFFLRHGIVVGAAVPCGSVQSGLIGVSGEHLERMIRDSQTPGDNVRFCLRDQTRGVLRGNQHSSLKATGCKIL